MLGVFNSGDANTLVKTGDALFTGNNNLNLPLNINSDGIMRIVRTGQWIHQTFSALQEPSMSAVRYGRNVGGETSWGDWALSDNNKPLSGKTIVNFGDSLFGNTQDNTSISNVLADITGAEVFNCGFGGCRMSKKVAEDEWDAFSMATIADEITKESSDTSRFKVQDTAIASGKMPWYFPDTLTKLKATNFSDVDILTIAYGTNDFTAGAEIGETDDNVNTFKGALNYSLVKILAKYPQLKILLGGQCYRFWMDTEQNFIEDSDTKLIANQKLTDFVSATKEVALSLHLPFLDNYSFAGINKLNRSFYFPETDGTHHNSEGRKLLASRYAHFMANELEHV